MKKIAPSRIFPRLNDYGAFEFQTMKLLPYKHHQIKFLWLVLVLIPRPKEKELPEDLKNFDLNEKEEEIPQSREFRFMVIADTAQEAAKEGVLAYQRNFWSEVPVNKEETEKEEIA